MDNNIEIFAKDEIKFNFLLALLDGRAEMRLFLESEGRDKYYFAIREGQDVQNFRIGSFAVKENPSDGSVVFRPVVVGCPAIFTITVIPTSSSGGFGIEVIRKGCDAADCRFELSPGENKLSLNPSNFKKYLSSFSRAAPNKAISRSTQGNGESVTIADIEIMAQDIEELKNVFGVDKDILSRYLNSGTDEENTRGLISEIEDHISRAQSGVLRLEEQIRLSVKKKRQKILDIENSIKNSGRIT